MNAKSSLFFVVAMFLNLGNLYGPTFSQAQWNEVCTNFDWVKMSVSKAHSRAVFLQWLLNGGVSPEELLELSRNCKESEDELGYFWPGAGVQLKQLASWCAAKGSRSRRFSMLLEALVPVLHRLFMCIETKSTTLEEQTLAKKCLCEAFCNVRAAECLLIVWQRAHCHRFTPLYSEHLMSKDDQFAPWHFTPGIDCVLPDETGEEAAINADVKEIFLKHCFPAGCMVNVHAAKRIVDSLLYQAIKNCLDVIEYLAYDLCTNETACLKALHMPLQLNEFDAVKYDVSSMKREFCEMLAAQKTFYDIARIAGDLLRNPSNFISGLSIAEQSVIAAETGVAEFLKE